MEAQMTQSSQQPQIAKSHFDAAKEIVAALQGMDKPSQALAMRFASETLGLSFGTVTQAPTTPIISPSTSACPSSVPIVGHSMDIKQFTVTKAPKSDQQFAAVISYYYRFEAPEAQRKETIDAEVLLEAARLAGRKRPPKPNITLNNAKNSGYLDSVSAGKFRINSVGENLVAMALPGNDSTGLPQRGTAKKKNTGKKTKAPNRMKRTAKTSKPHE
jgi:hypothetical protein